MARIITARRPITITAEAARSDRQRGLARISRPGRPSREVSASLGGVILDAATTLFLRDGYVATSMEAVAAAAGVSKRTLYARFADKSLVLRDCVARLVDGWLPAFDAASAPAATLDETLLSAGRQMLETALAPEALALYRLLVTQAGRLPDLPRLLREAGTNAGVARVAERLAAFGVADPGWAAAQFQTLVLSGPQHRALGFGPPLDAAGREDWVRRSVALFLYGCLPGR
jgi:TetR/AcrR family transcriptional repressor of mexJK operon